MRNPFQDSRKEKALRKFWTCDLTEAYTDQRQLSDVNHV